MQPMADVDWQVPNVQMVINGEVTTLHDALKHKEGIIFGVPGAFTPVCTQKHVPGFRDALPYLKEAVEYVACVAVNDPYVLKAWAKELGIPKEIVMISDWEGKFTKVTMTELDHRHTADFQALGLELDATTFHMGMRCRRFCILASHGTIVWFGLENDAFVNKIAVILYHLGLLRSESLEAIETICERIEESSHPRPPTRQITPNNEEPSNQQKEQHHWHKNKSTVRKEKGNPLRVNQNTEVRGKSPVEECTQDEDEGGDDEASLSGKSSESSAADSSNNSSMYSDDDNNQSISEFKNPAQRRY